MGSDVVIFWFRSDLRVGDNLALAEACASAGRLLPVYCHDPAADAPTRWGFARRGPHRRAFLEAALDDLDAALRARGSALLELNGAPGEVLPALARAVGTDAVVCEAIAAPAEEDELAVLRAAGLRVAYRVAVEPARPRGAALCAGAPAQGIHRLPPGRRVRRPAAPRTPGRSADPATVAGPRHRCRSRAPPSRLPALLQGRGVGVSL